MNRQATDEPGRSLATILRQQKIQDRQEELRLVQRKEEKRAAERWRRFEPKMVVRKSAQEEKQPPVSLRVQIETSAPSRRREREAEKAAVPDRPARHMEEEQPPRKIIELDTKLRSQPDELERQRPQKKTVEACETAKPEYLERSEPRISREPVPDRSERQREVPSTQADNSPRQLESKSLSSTQKRPPRNPKPAREGEEEQKTARREEQSHQEYSLAGASRRRKQLQLQEASSQPEPEIEPKPPRKSRDLSSEEEIPSYATIADRRREDESLSMQEEMIVPDEIDEPPDLEDPDDQLLSLSTSDSFIVDENGNAANLRGITILGLDTAVIAEGQSLRAALSLDDANLALMRDLWGMSVVRLVFQVGTLLNGTNSLSPAQVLAGLDDIVEAATAAGAYVLLALTPDSSSPGPGDNTFQASKLLATHYSTDPGVLYELRAPALSQVNWLNVALMLVGTIRQCRPGALVFLGNGSSGTNVDGLPLHFSTGDPVSNLVYTIQISTSQMPNLDDGHLLALANSYPVFASEWTDDGMALDRLAGTIAGFLERYGMGWAAANWNASPRLVTDSANHNFSPTGWGLVVQRAIKQPVRLLFQPFYPAVAATGS